MKEKNAPRDRWLTVRLSPEEVAVLQKLTAKTTCRSLSEYARNVLLKAPVTVVFRNASADSFLEEMVGLKRELNALGKNFNQAVQRLQTLGEVREVKSWLLLSEGQRTTLLKKTGEILQKLTQIHALWSQE